METKNERLKEYLDKFLDFVIKYSYKEKEQMDNESMAYKNGIISKKNYDNLKMLRKDNILILNSLVTNLNKASKLTEKNIRFENQICYFIDNIIQMD